MKKKKKTKKIFEKQIANEEPKKDLHTTKSLSKILNSQCPQIQKMGGYLFFVSKNYSYIAI